MQWLSSLSDSLSFYILFYNAIAHLPISEYDTNGYRKYAMKMADIRVENGATNPLTVFI